MNQPLQDPKLKKVLQWLVLVIAVGVLAFSLYWFISDLQSLMRSGGFQPIRHRRTLNVSTPDQIRSWMTFRYINLVFKLPPDYLKTALNIANKRYPNMLIGGVAKEQGKTTSQILISVQQAVTNYQSTLKP